MEHPFFPTTTTTSEAVRWLTISEKLLASSDLIGSKTFATRARDADPSFSQADQIIAIVDTLLAGEKRIGNNHDWYAILRVNSQQRDDFEAIASKYRSLAMILNPQTNKYPFVEQAIRLVVDAWSILSHPSSKSVYDGEIAFGYYAQQQPDPFHKPITASPLGSGGGTIGVPESIHAGGMSNVGSKNFQQHQQVHAQPQVDPLAVWSNQEQAYRSFTGTSDFATFSSGLSYEQENDKQKHPIQDFSNFGDETKNDTKSCPGFENDEMDEEAEEAMQDKDGDLTFWTACPYCYNMFEYFKAYFDCSLRCQNCRRAFQAVAIPAPPPLTAGQENFFCCWGFLPLGVSPENCEKNRSATATWTPFSPIFSFQSAVNSKEDVKKRADPKVYVEDDEVFIEISESSGSDID